MDKYIHLRLRRCACTLVRLSPLVCLCPSVGTSGLSVLLYLYVCMSLNKWLCVHVSSCSWSEHAWGVHDCAYQLHVHGVLLVCVLDCVCLLVYLVCVFNCLCEWLCLAVCLRIPLSRSFLCPTLLGLYMYATGDRHFCSPLVYSFPSLLSASVCLSSHVSLLSLSRVVVSYGALGYEPPQVLENLCILQLLPA